MKKLTATLTIAAILAAPATVAADGKSEEERAAYWDNRVCYVPVGDDPGRVIPVVDTFELGDRYGVNVGTTSIGFSPCLPTACPDGYTLVSASCWTIDPLAHVPDLGYHPTQQTETAAATAPEALAPLAVSVGPLVEPAIPSNHQDTP